MSRTMNLSQSYHYLSDSHYHNKFDNMIKPTLTIESGHTVIFDCEEATGGQITPDSTVEAIKSLDWSRIHHLTGPVAIVGAEPGDVLEIEVLEYKHKGWGWSCISPGSGLLAEDFGDTHALHIWKVGEDGRVKFKPGISIPIEPFAGIMAVAPAESGPFPTMPPRRTGGNMDIRHLIEGSALYLPIEVPGGLFSIGDCHLAQGDGEVCVTAIEAPMTVTLRFHLHKDRSIAEPQYMTSRPTTSKVSGMGYFATTSIGPDLYTISQNAVRYMIDHLVNKYELTREEAYILCSAAGDLQINEVVDAPNWVVSFQMPRSIFTE
jgi:acetamidase/formamidase